MGLSPEALEKRRAYSREYVRRRRLDPEFRVQELEYGREYEATKRQRPEGYSQSEYQRKVESGYAEKYRKRAAVNSRRSYWEDPEKRRAARRAYSQTEEAKAKAREYCRGWRKRNPGRRSAARRFAATYRSDPCAYCNGPAGEVDHIVPLARGGEDTWENLTAACLPCNRSKHARPLLVWLLTRR